MRAGATEWGGTALGSGWHAGSWRPAGSWGPAGARERRTHRYEWARVGPPGLQGAWARLRVRAAREGTWSDAPVGRGWVGSRGSGKTDVGIDV